MINAERKIPGKHGVADAAPTDGKGEENDERWERRREKGEITARPGKGRVIGRGGGGRPSEYVKGDEGRDGGREEGRKAGMEAREGEEERGKCSLCTCILRVVFPKN